jgi:hypothetical protein
VEALDELFEKRYRIRYNDFTLLQFCPPRNVIISGYGIDGNLSK